MRSIVVAGLSVLCLLSAPPTVAAHPVPFSYFDLHIRPADPGQLDGTLVIHIFDATHDLQIDPPERLLDASLVAKLSSAIIGLAAPRLTLRVDGRVVEGEWSQVEALPERQSIRLHVRYRTGAPPGAIAVTAALFPYDPTHQTFLNLYDGDKLTQVILDRRHPTTEHFAGTRVPVPAVVRTFVASGIQHILIGPDHLLFLVGLLLLGGTIRQLAFVVTAFTVAHSITLSLAALNLVTPSGRVIEPAIALSIVFVGADNLLVSNGRDVRAWIAFAFGFIHGFGFASVLREMGLPSRALGWSLFSFNVGVEIGQLAVVATVVFALGLLRSWSEVASRRLAFGGSIAVMAAGAFWFVQRVFFPGGIS